MIINVMANRENHKFVKDKRLRSASAWKAVVCWQNKPVCSHLCNVCTGLWWNLII